MFLGLTFFAGGIAAVFTISTEFCKFASHYIDGMFIATASILLAVMMEYKYWDSITTEDLEFSVGGAPSVWHAKNNELPQSDALMHSPLIHEDVCTPRNKSFFY